MVCSVLVLTVLNKETEVCGDNLLLPTCYSRRGSSDLGLRHISRSCNAVLLVKVDNETGLCTTGLALAVLIYLAVKNHITEGLTYEFGMIYIICSGIPVKADIHSCNYVTVAVSFGISCLLGHYFYTVVTWCRNHALITGNNLCVGVININLYYVSNLTVCTGSIVQYDLGLGDTGRKIIIIFRDEFVVIIFSFLIINCGKELHRQHTDQHHETKQK